MANKQLKWQLPFLLFLIIGTILILRKQAPYQTNQGIIFGTTYKITYQANENLKNEIEAELQKVDNSLSPFNKKSTITAINNNTGMKADSMFTQVFNLSKTISDATGGAFDITVAPLVNAWGFGFKNSVLPDSATVDSLLQFIGISKVNLVNGEVVKADSRVMLDCSAIAKGFGVDCVARLFDRKGVKNYMIEIGGELMMKGQNANMQPWHIGINKPVDDSLAVSQELQTVLEISNAGMATSGNYRNYYYKDGKKYAHTIDPRTGYPVQHNILSATVIAKDCATADAYATSFMVLGLDSARAICNAHNELDAYLIYSDENGNMQIFYTDGMRKYLKQ